MGKVHGHWPATQFGSNGAVKVRMHLLVHRGFDFVVAQAAESATVDNMSSHHQNFGGHGSAEVICLVCNIFGA